MTRLAEFRDAKLEWVQPRAFERSFELRAGNVKLASLSFRSALGTLAVAESPEGAFTFKRVGFLNPSVTARLFDQPEDIAVYEPRFWGDGILRLADGRSLGWRPLGFWAAAWAFATGEGLRVVEFRRGREDAGLSDVFKTQATVELREVAAFEEVLPMLASLGLYLIILHQQDVGATVAVT